MLKRDVKLQITNCLETWFVMSQSRHNLQTCMSCLEFPCRVMSHDYVLTVSLSSIANYLVCGKTLAFLAECTLLGPFTRCLLTYCKTVVVVLWLYRVLITVSWQCLSLKHFNSIPVSSHSNPKWLASSRALTPVS